MDLITVYVSRSAEENLRHGLTNGIWGFVEASKPNFEISEGMYLLLGNGFSGGGPRVDLERWRSENLSNAYLARVTSQLYESNEVEFPNEPGLENSKRYIWRFRFELLDQFRDVDLGKLPLDVSDKLRRSGISQSRAYLSEDVDLGALKEILSGENPEPSRPQVAKHKLNLMEINFDPAILRAIKTKPFILLAGISGTGKSRLVRTLAYLTCAKPELRLNPNKPGNFELISVRPNWHDSDELRWSNLPGHETLDRIGV